MSLSKLVRIRHIEDENERVRTLELDLELDQAEPGQFVMLWLPGVNEKPISIAWPAPLTVSVARVGPFSTAVHELRPGDSIGVRGPFGHGFALHARPALLVGGGYGAAPLYFLAARAAERGLPTTVALGARSAGSLLTVDRFRALGVTLLLATDDGSIGHHGRVVDALLERADVLAQRPAVYACGPERMLVALLSLCRQRGLPGQLSVERYMKCGFGICGQCAIGPLLACQDGPVLTVEQLHDVPDLGRFYRDASGQKRELGE